MYTPQGTSADNMERIMLLSMWAKALEEERTSNSLNENNRPNMIFAGMGKPTFAINDYTIQMQLAYWQYIAKCAEAAKYSKQYAQAAVDYGEPQGDAKAREIMSDAMSRWYDTCISPKHILFTIGGAGALYLIFETLYRMYHELCNYRILTPFPHYTLYANERHILHPIDVMQEPGYRITARTIEISIKQAIALAEKDKSPPKALLLCNPNNPLGTIIDESELQQIADVLRRYPDLHIILDEAYAEMCLDAKKAPSLLTIAPDLQTRTIILRSATKALSAAGERMAVLLAFDKELMSQLVATSIHIIGHAPRSSQIAYAETMNHFSEQDHRTLVEFYRKKVNYVAERLKAIGANMPDETYHSSATFYMLADLSDLMGLELPEASARALGKSGLVQTNEDIAYYLLFNDAIMMAPLSYSGTSTQCGFMRITCSGSEEELEELMNRLEIRLHMARKLKKNTLMDKLSEKLVELKTISPQKYADTMKSLIDTLSDEETCLSLKTHNQILNRQIDAINLLINRSSGLKMNKMATTIQCYFRRHQAQKEKNIRAERRYNEQAWDRFVEQYAAGSAGMQAYLRSMPIAERIELQSWRHYLTSKTKTSISNPWTTP